MNQNLKNWACRTLIAAGLVLNGFFVGEIIQDRQIARQAEKNTKALEMQIKLEEIQPEFTNRQDRMVKPSHLGPHMRSRINSTH